MTDIASFDAEIYSPVKLTHAQQDAITKSLHKFDLLSSAWKVNIPVLVLTGEYDGIKPIGPCEESSRCIKDEDLLNQVSGVVADKGELTDNYVHHKN